MSDNTNPYLDARVVEAQRAYDEAMKGQIPTDDSDAEAWRAYDELDRAEFRKYSEVVNEVRRAREAGETS